MTHAALKDLDARIEAVRKREKDGCPLARELRVLRDMCSCGNDDASVSEAEVRYLELAALSAMEGEGVDISVGDGVRVMDAWFREVRIGDQIVFVHLAGSQRAVDALGAAINPRYTAPPPQQTSGGNSSEVADMDGFFQQINPTPSPGPQGGGELRADGSLTYAGQRKVVEHMTVEIRDAIALLKSVQQRAETIDCQPIATPPAQQPGEVVTDEMVDRYIAAFNDTLLFPEYRENVRTALTAALAPKEAGHDR